MHGCLGGGFTRWMYLENTSTAAEIQDALNGDQEAVFLEAGTYNIGQNIVIPDGKTLSAMDFDTDPGTAANVILNIASGFQIQVQRGTLQFVRITIDVASVVEPVSCNGGRVLYTYVTTTAGISNLQAFTGAFAELGWCASYNIAGVHVNIALAVGSGQYQDIHNCYFEKNDANGDIVRVNNVDYVSFRDLHVENGNRCFYIHDSDFVFVENVNMVGLIGSIAVTFENTSYCKIHKTVSEVTGGTQHYLFSVFSNSTAFGIEVSSGVDMIAVNVDTCVNSTFEGVYVYTDGLYGLRFNSCSDCIANNCFIQFSRALAGGYAIYMNAGLRNTMTNIKIYEAQGDATTYGFYALNSTYSTIHDIRVYSSDGIDFYMSGCDYSMISQVYAQTGLSVSYEICVSECDDTIIDGIFARASSGEGIRIESSARLTVSNLYSDTNTGIGIHIRGCTDGTFSNLFNRLGSAGGICIGTAATAADLNVRCVFNGMKVYDSSAIGIAAYYSEYCIFSDLNSNANTTDGVLETNSLSCKFSDILSVANGQHGVNAGSGSSYCTWTNIHAQGNTGTNFFGVGATADCYYDGGYEQGAGVANDNFPLANWTIANVRAI